MAKQEQTNLQKLSSTLKDLSNAFKDSEGSLSDFIETAQKITAVMSIFETFGEIIDGNKEKFKAWRNIIEKFNEKLKKIPETFSLISKMMGLLVFNIPLKGEDIEKIDTFASSVKEKVGNAFDSVKGKLSNFKANISGVFESLKTNPFGTISAGLTKLGGLANSVFVGAFGGGIALAGIAIGGFIAYFAQLMETNEEFKKKITEAWAGVKEAFQPAIDAFGELFACLFTGKEEIDEGGTEIVDSFLAVAMGIIDAISGAVTFISDIFIAITDFIKDVLFSTYTDIDGQTHTTWDSIVEAFTLVWDLIKEIFNIGVEIVKGIWEIFGEDIVSIFSTVWDTVSNVLSGAMKVIKGVLEVIVGLFTLNFKKIKSGVSNILGGVRDVFSSIFKGILNFAIDKINFFIRKLNNVINLAKKIPLVGDLVGNIKIQTIPKLALGGLVQPGQMFIAREAGPELVASFGSKTAVMNNDQIVEAVSNGVYKPTTKTLQKNKLSLEQLKNLNYSKEGLLTNPQISCKKKNINRKDGD